MVDFPKYESYKNSGVEWLGEIPSHWDLRKNKFIFKEKKDSVGKKSNEFTLLSLTLQGVIARNMENPQGKFPAEFNTYKIVAPNDLIFCLFDIEETPRTVGHANQKGMITGAYTVIECVDDVNSRYLYYYYLSLDIDKRLQPLYTGLRKVIKNDNFFGIRSPVPPIEEQKKIVEFLDRKTAEIDQAIAQKQRLIELLQEQKAILINQAVTRGLDPNVPMCDRGIEWLGEMPTHWKLSQLKYCCEVIKDGLHITPAKHDEGINFISTQHIRNRKIAIDKATYISENAYKLGHPRVKPEVGDVLVTLVGSIGFAALVAREHMPLSFTRHVGYVRCKPNQLAQEYFIDYTESHIFKYFVEENVSQTAQPSIYLAILASHRLPLPPLDEQIKISKWLSKVIKSYLEAIDTALQEISIFQELKQVYIAEAVTGKIKV